MYKQIKIDKENFIKLKEILGKEIHDNCDFCDEKITENNFGFLAKDITCCSNIICIFELVDKFPELLEDSQKGE